MVQKQIKVPMITMPKIVEQQIVSEKLAEVVVALVVIMVVAMIELQKIVEIFVVTAQDMIVVPVQKHEQSKQELAVEASNFDD
eukprot:9003844-Heterocapsa_arctica.AAC.1